MNDIPDSRTIGITASELLYRYEPDWSVDKLLVNPKNAIALCVCVRRRLGKRIEDDQILQSLLNARKRGLLPNKRKPGRGIK